MIGALNEIPGITEEYARQLAGIIRRDGRAIVSSGTSVQCETVKKGLEVGFQLNKLKHDF